MQNPKTVEFLQNPKSKIRNSKYPKSKTQKSKTQNPKSKIQREGAGGHVANEDVWASWPPGFFGVVDERPSWQPKSSRLDPPLAHPELGTDVQRSFCMLLLENELRFPALRRGNWGSLSRNWNASKLKQKKCMWCECYQACVEWHLLVSIVGALVNTCKENCLQNLLCRKKLGMKY